MAYRYEASETDYFYQESVYPIDPNVGDLTIATITPAFLMDTRNNPYHPTDGIRFRSSLEIAESYLGSDRGFYKPTVEASWYFGGNKLAAALPGAKLRPYFAVHGELGFARGLGGDEMPIFERYYLGGERSLRAFETRTISPRILNIRTGEDAVFGGDQFYAFNFEYAVPLNPYFEVAAWFDAGNAWGLNDVDPISLINMDPDGDGFPDYTPDDFIIEDNDPWDIRYSAGLETRFFTPVFIMPIRLIFGWNLDPRAGEDEFDFQFSIGRTFD